MSEWKFPYSILVIWQKNLRTPALLLFNSQIQSPASSKVTDFSLTVNSFFKKSPVNSILSEYSGQFSILTA